MTHEEADEIANRIFAEQELPENWYFPPRLQNYTYPIWWRILRAGHKFEATVLQNRDLTETRIRECVLAAIARLKADEAKAA